MKRIIGVGAIAVGLALAGAAPAQASCAWFGSNPSNGICGVPNLSQTASNAQTNLQNNLNLSKGLGNLGYALTHGVGSNG